MLQLRRLHYHRAVNLIGHSKCTGRKSKWPIFFNQNMSPSRKASLWKGFCNQSCIKMTNLLKPSWAGEMCFLPCRCMSSTKNHYEVLGLGKNASSEDIRAAFLRRSKECHPDLNRSNPENHRQFVQLNEAYSVLSRPQTRKHYDSALDHSVATAGRPPPAYSDYYRHPRESSAEDWLKQSGLREEYFRPHTRQRQGGAGSNKISNFHIVASCLVFMLTGIVFHFFAVKRSSEKHIQSLNDRDLRTHELWINAKKAAKKFTPQELTQDLLDKQEIQKDRPKR